MVNGTNGIYYYVCSNRVYYAHNFEVTARFICERKCSTVWYQGPMGGVKLIKQVHDDESVFPYVSKNEKLMREFIWVKLKAQPYIIGDNTAQCLRKRVLE